MILSLTSLPKFSPIYGKDPKILRRLREKIRVSQLIINSDFLLLGGTSTGVSKADVPVKELRKDRFVHYNLHTFRCELPDV